MKPVPALRLAALVSLAFSLSFSVGVLEPAVLGHKILQLAGDARNTALGFVTSGGLLVATLTQPLVGIWSDRTRTPLGRRVPFLIGGTALVVVFLYLIAFAPVFSAVVAGYLAFQFGSNTAQGPWQTVFPEHVPEEQRGMASAVRAIFEVLGSVLGRLAAGQIVSMAPSLGNTAVVLAVSLAGVVAVISMLIVARAVRVSEKLSGDAHTIREEISSEKSPDADGGPDEGVRPGFVWWCVNRFLFWVGFMAVTTFLLFFVIDVLNYPEAAAQKLIGQLSAVIGVVLLASLVPVGKLADRIGRRPLVILGGALAGAGTLCVLLTRSVAVISLSAGFIGLGVGMYLSSNWALVTDLVPAKSAARYLGIANTAGASGSVVARLAGGAIIDALNRAHGSTAVGYRAMYGIAAAAFALSTLCAFKLPHSAPGSSSRPMAVPPPGG